MADKKQNRKNNRNNQYKYLSYTCFCLLYMVIKFVINND